MPKISVIVPVYNAEKYLHRCIDSILAQTFTDFELLLINDGSTDSSGGICDEYAVKDSRIRVFHKKNGGVSSARNLGLDKCIGEFVSFVDSDDWVENTYLADFFPIESEDFISNYYVAEGWVEWTRCPLKNKMYFYEDLPEFFSGDLNKMNFVWSKLFKKEVIEMYKLRFDSTISYGEDTLFIYTFISYSRCVRTKGNAVYHYNCHSDNSLSNSFATWEKYEYAINAICHVIENIEQNFDWNGYHAFNIVVKNHFGAFIRHVQIHYSISDSAKALKSCASNKYVMSQIRDNKTYTKSIGRKVFDWLIINKMYWLCAFFMYWTYTGKVKR